MKYKHHSLSLTVIYPLSTVSTDTISSIYLLYGLLYEPFQTLS